MARRKLIAKLLALVMCLFTQEVAVAQSSTEATSCHVLGTCHDYYTALGVKASIYGLVNQKKVKLAECDSKGLFDAQLPVKSTHLIFEMEGYKTIKLPVYFAPNLVQNDRFGIWTWGEMVPKDSFPTLPRFSSSEKGSLHSKHYHFDDIVDIEEEEMNESNESVSNKYLRTKGIILSDIRALPTKEGKYVRRIRTTDGLLISQSELTIRRGITFESIRIAIPTGKNLSLRKNVANGPSAQNKEVTLPASTSDNSTDKNTRPTEVSIYFEQSSYELPAKTKALLDSIAYLLVNRPDLKASLTGYTDNVGDQKLNLTLSEYRAKVVNNHLKNRGVSSGQLRIDWKGPDPKASPDDIETLKAKARRVLIQFDN